MNASKSLGDGLVMRWATAEDAEELVRFNFDMHNSESGGMPELWLKAWTRDLSSGQHPTTCASDFTIVVDENDNDRIVSSAVLISQVWSYSGVSFGCGRPELIATHPDYRRRGLIRAQMELMHAKSAERGELAQAITGIPWFYRQFGYEMVIDLSGGRRLELTRIPGLKPGAKESFSLRRATADDIDHLQVLYEATCALSLVSCQRDATIWRHELTREGLENLRNLYMIESAEGTVVGYTDLSGIGRLDIVRELTVVPGASLREVCLFLARWLKSRLEINGGSSSSIYFRLGVDHPAYEALGPELGEAVHPYAWYMRVPDLPAFLLNIRPVLEDRLAKSVMAGYSGTLRMNFYQVQRTLRFDSGRLVEIGTYQPAHFFDTDVCFPEQSFLQLLFGYRSLEEIRHIRPDCLIERDAKDAAILLRSLFPTRPSQIFPLG